MTIKIYVAQAMSGIPAKQVVENAGKIKNFLENAGFEVLCPVAKEELKPNNIPIQATREEITNYWKIDKSMIRDSHILFHMSPHLNSAGAWQEVGYQRYHLQGPVVHIYPLGKLPPSGAIPRLENDYVCDSLEEAIEYTLRVHGTFLKRTMWRIKKLNRCFLKSFWYQLNQWIK